MSLHAAAQHLASKGRDEDSLLVHMTPGEVHGLQALAMSHGGSLTINPDTGLVEAGFLKKLLPTLVGLGASFFGMGPLAAAALGAGTGAVTNKENRLMGALLGGIGAYGGAQLGAGFNAAGTAASSSAVPPGMLETVSPEWTAQAAAEYAKNTAPASISAATSTPALSVAEAAPVQLTPPVQEIGQGLENWASMPAPGVAAQRGFLQNIDAAIQNPSQFAKSMGGGSKVFNAATMAAAPFTMAPMEEVPTGYKNFRKPVPGKDRRFRYDAGYTGGVRLPGAAFSSEKQYFNPRYIEEGTYAGGGQVTRLPRARPDFSPDPAVAAEQLRVQAEQNSAEAQRQSQAQATQAAFNQRPEVQAYNTNESAAYNTYYSPAATAERAALAEQNAQAQQQRAQGGIGQLMQSPQNAAKYQYLMGQRPGGDSAENFQFLMGQTPGAAPGMSKINDENYRYLMGQTAMPSRNNYTPPATMEQIKQEYAGQTEKNRVSDINDYINALGTNYANYSPAARAYLFANPDVLEEARKNRRADPFEYARQHYDRFGRREGRADQGFAQMDLIAQEEARYREQNHGGGQKAGGGLRSGGFVIPADVVSALGNGSSSAGLELLSEKMGAQAFHGPGDGMSDSIPTTIEGKQKARVAREEAYLSPEQVKQAGGTKKLYAMLDRIRTNAHGKTSQQRQINPAKVLNG